MTTISEYVATDKCGTDVLKGLATQIANMLLPVAANNLVSCEDIVEVVGGSTLPFLQPAVKNALAKAVAERGTRPKLIHAYRTVAQQYVLHYWFSHGQRCRIKKAAKPGRSPHELGIAIDIESHEPWIDVLLKHKFKTVTGDPGHFQYTGTDINGDVLTEGVRAFQRLWNQHNPQDKIKEDGIYGATETGARLIKSPLDGFH
jgi:N-acetylmuramoyl-L-alanine amidase